jgi:hypothetical protein
MNGGNPDLTGVTNAPWPPRNSRAAATGLTESPLQSCVPQSGLRARNRIRPRTSTPLGATQDGSFLVDPAARSSHFLSPLAMPPWTMCKERTTHSRVILVYPHQKREGNACPETSCHRARRHSGCGPQLQFFRG